MTTHQGDHPRLGAVDVVTFNPIQNVTIDECILASKEFGKSLSEKCLKLNYVDIFVLISHHSSFTPFHSSTIYSFERLIAKTDSITLLTEKVSKNDIITEFRSSYGIGIKIIDVIDRKTKLSNFVDKILTHI